MTSSSRERGTLSSTLPSAFSILSVYILISTAFATFASQESLSSKSQFTFHGIDFLIVSKAFLGVLTSFIGNLFVDPLIHSLALVIGIFLSMDPNSFSKDQSTHAILPFLTMALCQLSPVKQFMAKLTFLKHKSFNTTSQIAHKNIMTGFAPLFPLVLVGCSYMTHLYQDSTLKFAPVILILMGCVHISHTYYERKSHENNLLRENYISGVNILLTASIIVATIQMILNSSSTVKETIMDLWPFLIGALVGCTMTASIAGVADVWYPIGTGQFQMISLDTSSIGFYIFLPCLVLFYRFIHPDKYGPLVSHGLELMSTRIVNGTETLLTGVDTTLASDTTALILVALVLLIVSQNVVMVNALCPLSGHVFGNVFCYGQPNTKRVAIMMDYKNLVKEESGRNTLMQQLKQCKLKNNDAMDKVFKANVKIDPVLNIIVTAQDLQTDVKDIEMLLKDGHQVMITCDESGASSSIVEAFQQYKQVMDGKIPSWYHTGSNMKGTLPRNHSMARQLGLMSAMWTSMVTCEKEVECIKTGLAKHRGGLFIYVNGADGNESMSLLSCILKNIEGDYVPAAMSFVARDVDIMKLET
ncbi:hypothetical protein CTEN210_00312 [Chaetoceros tenuissimus]|uniref:Uncharacterized protein n=1 Tax=Chaetoceros tenuissimus TaxID=426638 RepID=A0AAD3CDV5_9STRA|nr:hypothetical protein CTEN210_00312 [Chaetoceros tenuissimus]